MKITFIYAYENEEWSTPLSLAYEVESKGWDVNIVSIGSNRTGQYFDDNIKDWLSKMVDILSLSVKGVIIALLCLFLISGLNNLFNPKLYLSIIYC